MRSSLWLLSHLSDSPTASLLQVAAEGLGVGLELVSPSQLSCSLASEAGNHLFLDGVPTEPPAAALVRLGGSATSRDLLGFRVLESTNVPTVNSFHATETCRDKMLTYRRLAARRVPMPETAFFTNVESIEENLLPVGPWIVKPPVGAKGLDVRPAETVSEVRDIASVLVGRGSGVLVQRLIHESFGRDTRVLVVDGVALVAMERVGRPGDVRSNLYQGGTAIGCNLDATSARIAVAAAEAVGAELAGVDLLRSKQGPLVCEVNGSPGLEGLSTVSDVDLAGTVLSLLVRRGNEARVH